MLCKNIILSRNIYWDTFLSKVVRLTALEKIIATDKRGYPLNIFLISRQKHMLWGTSNKYPQHMFLLRNKNNISIFWMRKVPYLLL